MKRWMTVWMAGMAALAWTMAAAAGVFTSKPAPAKPAATKPATAEPATAEEPSRWEVEVEDSELIGRIGYDGETEELRIQMVHSSDWYVYKGVPEKVARGLRDSKSKGGYFGAHVKGRYAFDRIEE